MKRPLRRWARRIWDYVRLQVDTSGHGMAFLGDTNRNTAVYLGMSPSTNFSNAWVESAQGNEGQGELRGASLRGQSLLSTVRNVFLNTIVRAVESTTVVAAVNQYQ